MKKISFLLTLLQVNFLNAQNTFHEIIDSSLSIVDPLLSYDGNLIVGSNLFNPLFIYEHTPNLTKIDLHGNVLWSKSYVYDPWYESPQCFSILQTMDSGFVLGCEINTAFFGERVGVIHVDKNGNLLWSKEIGSTYFSGDFCYSITSSSDGGVIYCGRVINNMNNSDAFIVKINASGDMVWSYSYGESYFEIGEDIVASDDGSFIIAGIGVIDTSYTGYPFLAKIDSIGSVVWAERLEMSEINDLVATDNGFVVCGEISDQGNSFNSIIIKFDSAGNLIWNKQIDFNNLSYAEKITATADNGFLLGCYPSSVIKCDSAGSIEWIEQYGDSSKSGTYVPLVAPDSTYFYCGIFAGVEGNYGTLIKSTDKGISFCNERSPTFNTFQANIDVYPTSLTRADLNYVSVDYPLSTVIDTLNTIVLCANVGIATLNEDNKWLCFPNPFTSSLTISFSLPKSSMVSMEVFNLLGQNVKTILQNEKQEAGKHQYHFIGTGEGIYFVKLTVNGISASQKIIQVK